MKDKVDIIKKIANLVNNKTCYATMFIGRETINAVTNMIMMDKYRVINTGKYIVETSSIFTLTLYPLSSIDFTNLFYIVRYLKTLFPDSYNIYVCIGLSKYALNTLTVDVQTIDYKGQVIFRYGTFGSRINRIIITLNDDRIN